MSQGLLCDLIVFFVNLVEAVIGSVISLGGLLPVPAPDFAAYVGSIFGCNL
jgi:hypothetical protein